MRARFKSKHVQNNIKDCSRTFRLRKNPGRLDIPNFNTPINGCSYGARRRSRWEVARRGGGTCTSTVTGSKKRRVYHRYLRCCPRLDTGCPLPKSHIITSPFSAAEIATAPSGEQLTDTTGDVCPSIKRTQLPVCTSNMRRVQSSEPVIKYSQFGCHAAQQTSARWPTYNLR